MNPVLRAGARSGEGVMADDITAQQSDPNDRFTLGAVGADAVPDVIDLTNESKGNDNGHSGNPLAELLASANDALEATGLALTDDPLPAIDDVSGLEDLYRNTTDRVDFDSPTIEQPEVRVFELPTSELPPTFGIGGNLRFSTEARTLEEDSSSSPGHRLRLPGATGDQPVSLVPPPMAPSRGVRGPGQRRARHPLIQGLQELSERRWFWSSSAALFGLVVVAGLTSSGLIPNMLDAGRGSDVVTEGEATTSVPTDVTEADLGSTSQPVDGSPSSARVGGGLPELESDRSESSSTTAQPTTSRSVSKPAPTARRTTTTASPTTSTTSASSTSDPTVDPSSTLDTTSTSSGGSTTVDPTSSTTDSSTSTDTTTETTVDPSSSTTEDTTSSTSGSTTESTSQ